MSVRLAVIGHPIAHSLSPAMHRAGLAALGRDDVSYEAIDVGSGALGAVLARLHDEGFVGLNVTLPHKTSVLEHVAEVDDLVRALGAANVLIRRGAGWAAANTDVEGLSRSLAESGVVTRDARAVVLGAGGAARASVMALADATEVIVVARRSEAAEEVARLHPHGRFTTFDDTRRVFASADVIVQASSATLGPGADAFAAALPIDRAPGTAVVVDLVYRPRETAVLARARARGLRVVDGVGMLVHQGVASMERWIGARPPADAMRAAVLAAL